MRCRNDDLSRSVRVPQHPGLTISFSHQQNPTPLHHLRPPAARHHLHLAYFLFLLKRVFYNPDIKPTDLIGVSGEPSKFRSPHTSLAAPFFFLKKIIYIALSIASIKTMMFML
jgi:hypothetical protein